MSADEKKIQDILSYINDNHLKSIPTTGFELLGYFGGDAIRLLPILRDKGLVEHDATKNCYFIKNEGIEALGATSNTESKKEQQEFREEKAIGSIPSWIKLGVIASIIISIAALANSFARP
ncbi:MAG: hypothetical protein ACE5RJ_06015 [Nitrosopumilaceae archaeon]